MIKVIFFVKNYNKIKVMKFIERQKKAQNIQSYDLVHEKIFRLSDRTQIGYLLMSCQAKVFKV